MSTDDEQRVRNSHYNRITCNGPCCPGDVQHADSAGARSGRHTAGNRAAWQAIPWAVGGRRPLEVSPDGSSRAPARTRRKPTPPAADAGSHTRCRRGSPRDGACDTVCRSWSERPTVFVFQSARRSGGVGAAHAAAALSRALVLVQPTPRAVLLRPRHGVVQAFKPYRASSANLLRLALPDVPLRLALTIRTEKEQQVFATARCSILPTPVRAGKHSRLPTYLRHGSITSTKVR